MTFLSDVLSSTTAGRLGWTLLHSVWQFACIAVVLWAALTVLRRRSANVRYLVACLALLATLASSAVTFHLVPDVAAPRVSLAVAGEPGDAVVTEPTGREAIDGPRAALPVVPPHDSEQKRVSSLPLAERTEFARDGGSALPLVETDVTGEATAAATITDVVTPWLPWVSLFWIGGVVVLSLRNLGGWIGVQRLRSVGAGPIDGELAQRVRSLSVRMRVSRPVRVLQSTLVEIPIVVGWLRPLILLPASLITGLSASQLEAILAHELAHIRRHDYLVNLVQTVAETLLFYHPGVWWISRQIRLERENCCDDAAVRVCGSKTVLAEALTEIEASRLPVGPALAATGNRLGFTLRRVRRLLNPKVKSAGPSQAAAAVLALTLLGMMATAGFVALATAEDDRQGVHSAHVTPSPTVSPEDDLSVADPVEEPTAAQPKLTKTYDVGGLTIEAGFLPDQTEIILGQPSFVTFSVTNRGDRPYRFDVGGDNRGSVRHNNFRITAVDAQGRPVKDPHSYNNFGGPAWEITLKPGESHTERLYLGHWLAPDRTGTYTVTCRRTLDDFGPPPRQPEAPIATRFELKVIPYNRAAMQQVIARFGKDVRTGDEQTLRDATLALADIDDPEVIAHLAASLSRGDFQNRIPAVKGLARFSTDAAGDALREALKDPDHAVREAAGWALRETKQVARVVKTLIRKLGDQSPEVRRTAATALGQTGSAAALDPLIEALDDSDSAVRQAAAVTLGELGDERATEPLQRRLRHSDRVLRVAAADGLRRLTGKLDPKWLTPVIRETTDINDQTFHESIRLIRVYADTAAAPALIGCLRFDDASLKGHHNFFLILAIHHARNGPDCYYRWKHDPNIEGTPKQIENNRKILEELKQWAAERSAETVRRAVQIVEGMRGMSMQSRRPRSDGKPDPIEDRRRDILNELRVLGKDSVPALCDALRDQNVQMRRNAALVLIELRGEWTGQPVVDTRAAVPALITATKDADADVRAWAAHALAEMGSDAAPAVDALIELIEDPQEGPRNTSAMALGKIGQAAAKAVPALTRALADKSEDVRSIAAAALERIRKADSSPRERTSQDRPKHHFAIYRVLGHRNALPFGGKEKTQRRKIMFSGISDEGDGSRRFDSLRPENYPLDGLILDETPLLTDADVVGYDWRKHEIHLKPGVRQRVLGGIKPSVWGVPFALVAGDEPVYLGAFWTGASSHSANMPTISVDPWQWSLPKEEPNHLPENAIRIENSRVLKPGEKPGDPRANPRLRQALDRAGKLLDLRPAEKPASEASKTASGEAVDVVAFYLLDENVPSNALRGDLSKLKLAKEPLLTLQDIITVDSQGILLKERARKRLFEGTGWEEFDRDRVFTEAELQQRRAIGRRSLRPNFNLEPFVLVVDGRRILGGHIMGPAASPIEPAILYSPPNKPVQFFSFEKKQLEAFNVALRREGKLAEWGPAVDGVQCRLRLEKTTWEIPQPPHPSTPIRILSKVDFRNGSEQTWSNIQLEMGAQHIQWDGKWHSMFTRAPLLIHRPVRPGDVILDLDYALGDAITGAMGDDSSDPIGGHLEAGRHTVRVVVYLTSGDRQIKVVSNPVEIEIVAGKPGNAAFGPVIERPITSDFSKATTYLDLETGKYATPEPNAIGASIGWLRKHGVDIQSSEVGSVPGLRTAVDMSLRKLPDSALRESSDWTPDEARTKLGNLEGAGPGRVVGTPSVYAFRTREGSLGIMQLVAAPKNKSEVTVRYKLLKASTAEGDKTSWGPAVDGVACAVRPVKASFAPGEAIVADVVYKNVSDRPVTVCVCPDPFYTWVHLSVKTAEGRIAMRGQHGSGVRPPLKLADFATLKPGQTASFRQVIAPSPHPERRLEPGRYFLHAEINKINRIDEHLHGYNDFCKKHGLNPWVAVIESGETSVLIAAEAPAETEPRGRAVGPSGDKPTESVDEAESKEADKFAIYVVDRSILPLH